MLPILRLAEPKNFDHEAKALLANYFEIDSSPVNEADLDKALGACDVFWFRLGFRLDATLLKKARCKIIATPVTGIDQIDIEACKELGISIVSLKGETEFLREIRATAEHTLALTLALIRKIHPAVSSVGNGIWDRTLFPGSELYGKTVGIVGVGRLGTICAEYFRMLGMHVLGYDPKPSIPAWIERKERLEDLVAESDIVSLHVVAKPSTDKLINKDILNSFKQTAFLINTSRGSLVCEKSLLDALHGSKIAGAALDVLVDENKVNKSHPLVKYAREHSNLIMTPHLGGNTPESFVKTERFLARQVINAFKNKKDML